MPLLAFRAILPHDIYTFVPAIFNTCDSNGPLSGHPFDPWNAATPNPRSRHKGIQMNEDEKKTKRKLIQEMAILRKELSALKALTAKEAEPTVYASQDEGEELLRRREMEELLTKASMEVINVDTDSIDHHIQNILRQIAEFVRADRAFLLLFSEDQRLIEQGLEWMRQGLHPLKDHFFGQPADTFPWALERFRRFEFVNASEVQGLPVMAARERAFCMSHGIRSFLMVPLFLDMSLIGAVGMTGEASERIWTDRDTRLLQLAGNLLANTLARRRAGNHLRTTNDRLKAIIDSSPLAIIALDRDENVRMWSPAAERLFGWRASEAIGRPLPFVPAEKEEESRDYRRRALQGESLTGVEIVRRRRDGSPVDIRLFTAPLRDAEGKTIGIMSAHEDITGLKRAERALTESEKRARRLALENAVIAEIGRVIGSTLNIEEVYERFAKKVCELIPFDRISIGLNNLENRTIKSAYVAGTVLGNIRAGSILPLPNSINEQLLKRRSSLLIRLENEDQILRDFPVALDNYRAGIRSVVSVPLLSKNEVFGALHIQSVNPDAYTEEDLRLAERVALQISGAMANAQIYAALIQIEQALREEISFRTAITQNAAEGLCVCHKIAEFPYHVFTLWNDKMTEITQYTMEEINRFGWHQTLFPDPQSQSSVTEHISRLKEDEGFLGEPWEITRRDGEKRTLSASASVLQAPGSIMNTLTVVHDMTDWKRAEASLQESEKRSRTLALENAVIAEIGRIIGSTLNIEEVYERFAQKVRELVPFERIMIGLNNLEAKTITNVYLAGPAVGAFRAGSSLPFQNSINEQLLNQGTGLLLRLENEDQVLHDFPSLVDNFRAGFRSGISVPLVSKNEVIGGLHIQSVNPDAYTEEDLRLAERVALQISGAIANAQMFAEHLQMGEWLKKSEERYRSVVEYAPLGIGVTHRHKHLFVNSKMVEMSGYSGQELTSSPFLDFIYQEDRAMVSEYHLKRLNGEPAPESYRVRVVHKDGGIRWWRVDVAPLPSDDQPTWLTFFIDITDSVEREETLERYRCHLEELVEQRTAKLATLNKQFQEEIAVHLHTKDSLSQSEQRYREIIETAQEGIWITDASGRTDYVNLRLAAMLEGAANEILHRPVTDFMGPEAHPLWNRFFERCGMGIKERDDFKFRTMAGNDLWAVVACSPRYDEHGQFEGTLLMVTDITERKETEEKIVTSKRMLQAIFDGISEPLLMIDKSFVVRMLNVAALSYYRTKTFQEIIGKPLPENFEDHDPSQRGVRFAVEHDLPLTYERTHPLDPHRTERIVVYPLKPKESRDGDAIIRITDITEAKLLQREVIQNEKLASLGLLISTVAHELNNPNNFISFNLPILRDYFQEILPVLDDYATAHPGYEILGMPYVEFRDDLFRLIKNVEHGASRITTVVSNLREFSRRKDHQALQWVPLKEIVEKAADICAGELKTKVKSFTIHRAEDPLNVYTDPSALEQVVVNLLINAIQALNKEDPWIKITIAPDPSRIDRVAIEVSDNGCGIDPALQDRIFEPFFTTKPPGTGTGLGLYVCRNLIEQLGGELTIESEPGEGSTFRISLDRWRKDPARAVDLHGKEGTD
jgi:PAS domain S-box-containing protein